MIDRQHGYAILNKSFHVSIDIIILTLFLLQGCAMYKHWFVMPLFLLTVFHTVSAMDRQSPRKLQVLGGSAEFPKSVSMTDLSDAESAEQELSKQRDKAASALAQKQSPRQIVQALSGGSMPKAVSMTELDRAEEQSVQQQTVPGNKEKSSAPLKSEDETIVTAARVCATLFYLYPGGPICPEEQKSPTHRDCLKSSLERCYQFFPGGHCPPPQ